MPSMGMDKSGTQALPLSTWTKITSWTVRTGYPSTVITSDTLAINAAGGGNIRFRGAYTAVLGTQQFRVVRNGSTVLGSAANQGVTTTINSITVSPGDTLELQGFASSNGWNVVNSGAANTFLEWNQTTTDQTIGGSQTIGWAATGAVNQGQGIAGDQTIGWSATGATSVGQSIGGDQTINWAATGNAALGKPIGGDQTINWAATGDTRPGIHYTAGGDQTIGWSADGGLLLIPKVVSPPSIFSFAEVSVSVHTVDGRAVGEFPCEMVGAFSWSRESNEITTASLEIMTQGDPELIEGLRQWVHWITIWHDDEPVWTGPLYRIRITRSVTSLSARDPAIFMHRTRLPITRTWTDTAPARIADPLWRAMFQLHGYRTTPVVLPGVAEATFSLAAVADSKYLHQFMEEMVKVGLNWTVVAGRPVLGTFSREPVAELYECDFMVELERVRDGSTTYNDVRVQGQNWAQTAVVDLAGLHLQGLVSLDDMYGASNIQKAAQQYARDSARIRDDLVVPAGASLHPQAPVTLGDLVPGKVWAVHYEQISQLMRLDQVNVNGGPGSLDVQVTLVALEATGDVAKLVGGQNG